MVVWDEEEELKDAKRRVRMEKCEAERVGFRE